MATVFVNIAVEVDVPDEDMKGYDDNAMAWAMDNVSVDVEAPNYDMWIDDASLF